ncbi:MAG: hypothetical protein AB7T63_05785 [Planctomycetota bacterium]
MGSTWPERLDALRDRFTLRALVLAAVAVSLLFLLTIYGAVLLGTRVTLPTLALLPFWAGLLAIVLWMPWDWGDPEPSHILGQWVYWEGLLVCGSVATVAALHGKYLHMLADALKGPPPPQDEPWQALLHADRLQALRDDVLGAALMSEVGYLPIALLGVALLLDWWILR